MGTRDQYTPGTFCWVDLVTTDPAAAKAFYGELFGWTSEDTSAEEAGAYSMLRCDGDDVAAVYEMEAGRREMGVPPHWFSYIAVEDVDATAARVAGLGGTVLGEPFDVMEIGRIAVMQDPTGGTVGAFQPGAHFGAHRVNDVGCLTWNELQTRDPEAAMTFYNGVFGWEMERAEQDGKLSYVTITNGGSKNGGIFPLTEQHGSAPTAWIPYFTVASADDAAKRVTSLGGGVLVEPFDLPKPARIAIVHDPRHAVFAVFEGETDD